jgi:CRP/FNR family cyclic AMP-dependent transcriptional regulator
MLERSSAGGQGAPSLEDELGRIPLLAGMPEAELSELAWAVRRRDLRAGEVLWRQGEEAEEMVFVAEGAVSLSVSLPGRRTVDVATARAGEVLGEVALIDGGLRTLTATATERTRLLIVTRADFAVLVSRRHPTAFALKRRLAEIACARIRGEISALGSALAEEARGGPPHEAPEPFADLEDRRAPDSRYIRRLANFHAFDPLALWGILTAGRYAFCPAGSTLIAEGTSSPACCLVINGAVEKVIVRGARRIRVGLAGPGHALAYETLIDGGPSTTTAITRERALLLLLPQPAFARLFGHETAGSHAFLDVILRDLTAALRQVMRPQAHLTVSR